MNLQFTAEASQEADIARLRYDLKRRGLGDDFATALDAAVEAIREHPRMWPRDPSVASAREVRIFTIDPFSYMVVYEVRAEEIVVLAIAHLHQAPGSWKGRRG